MTALTKMKLVVVPMILVTFIGLKTFLDNRMVLVPVLCIVGLILSFALLVKWNVERLRGR
jgi:amino acid permease